MAVARIILASIAIALVAAQDLTCGSIQAPGNNMNYYVPPDACKTGNSDVAACFTAWGQCTGNVSTCSDINVCFQSVLVCLDNVPAPTTPNMTSPCYSWNESFANVKMYLDMGGTYSGSALEAACNYAACQYIPAVATRSTLNNGSACAAPQSVCTSAPKPPPKFVLTFGGDWTSIFASKPEEIKTALQQGIARLLGVQPYAIRILAVRLGSLVVEFAVLDPSVDGNTVATKLGQAAADSTVLASAFTELAAAAPGITLQITNVAVGAGGDTSITLAPPQATATPTQTPAATPTGTPTPTTAAPSGSGASVASVAAAVALVAMSLLF